MAWITVTDLAGRSVFLCTEQLIRIRPFIPKEDAGPASSLPKQTHDQDGDVTSAKAMIHLVAGMQATREAPEEIMERIKEALREERKEANA